MAQLSSERADAAQLRDDSLMFHTHGVQSQCTVVNVECVRAVDDNFAMAEHTTRGEIIRALMTRAGYSVRAFALAAGYKHGSGVQRYIEPDFDEPLTLAVGRKLADALEGRGQPPIARGEIMALIDLTGIVEAEPNTTLAPRYQELPRDVPVYGTALGTFTEDDVIEQTMVDQSETIDFVIRPPGLSAREGIYGLYVQGESQSPRFKPGELIFVDPKRTPMIGDDVVVFLKRQDGDEEMVNAILLKELVRRTHGGITLRQLNPDATFDVEAKRIGAIHRVLTNYDLFGGYR